MFTDDLPVCDCPRCKAQTKPSLMERVFRIFFKRPAQSMTFDKHGVMDMRIDYPNKSWEHSDITPCDAQILNDLCPCPQGSHRLNYKKEALSNYKHGVWATKCAIKDLFDDMERVIVEQFQMIETLRTTESAWKKQSKEATEWTLTVTKLLEGRAEHAPFCHAIDPIMAIRGAAQCNCNLPKVLEVLTNTKAWLNGK